MGEIIRSIEAGLWTVFNRIHIADIADIIIVAFLLYQLVMLTKQTRASAVIKGLVIIIVANWLSSFLGLTALPWLLDKIIQNGAIVLVILFQPELRKALEQIGRGTMLENSHSEDEQDSRRIVDEVTHSLLNLSRRRVGALVVFEQRTGLNDIIDTGTRLDAMISRPLLENIFEPNTPLHDGAVVIRGPRVMAAGCILALSEGKGISRDLGTRHRAALGVSESTDAIVLIVSEETGIISLAKGGRLVRHLDANSLSQILRDMYQKPAAGIISAIRTKARSYKAEKGGGAKHGEETDK